MYLLSQNEDAIIDFDKFCTLEANEKGEILAYNINDNVIVIGKYKDTDRAKSVIKEIFALIECQSQYDMPVI